ncbi:hypothetical protein SUGI_0567010 [Cryptomeria japonica]|nr:hypothetical protein SUGI_0567010 [Cryptomeria japonica]
MTRHKLAVRTTRQMVSTLATMVDKRFVDVRSTAGKRAYRFPLPPAKRRVSRMLRHVKHSRRSATHVAGERRLIHICNFRCRSPVFSKKEEYPEFFSKYTLSLQGLPVACGYFKDDVFVVSIFNIGDDFIHSEREKAFVLELLRQILGFPTILD